MFKCDWCGNELDSDSFVLHESIKTINGIRYNIEWFKCSHCNKRYVINISVGNFREEWRSLVKVEQELKELLYIHSEDFEEVKQKKYMIEHITSLLKAMANKGQELMSLLNI